jgi:hypothetical protein
VKQVDDASYNSGSHQNEANNGNRMLDLWNMSNNEKKDETGSSEDGNSPDSPTVCDVSWTTWVDQLVVSSESQSLSNLSLFIFINY